MQITRINDTLLFLQTTDLQRNQEQVIFGRNLSKWADWQETTTNQLMLEQQCLRAVVDSTQAAIDQVAGAGQTERRNLLSYLQVAHVATHRIRQPALPTEDPDPSEGSHAPERTQEEPPENEGIRDEQLTQLIAPMIASTLAMQTAQTTNGSSTPADLRVPCMACLKLENPNKFDRKPKTLFRTGWYSV